MKKLILNNTFQNSLLILFGFIFLGRAFYNLLIHGSDFQTIYELSVYFSNQNDVYNWVEKNPSYPQFSYLLVYPFTIFEFTTAKIIFFFINLFLLLGSIVILIKNYFLNKYQAKILILIALTATPTTNLLAIGNLSIITLFFLLIYFFSNSIFIKAIGLLIAFMKYNVSFLFVIFSLLEKEYKTLLFFSLFYVLGVFFYYLYLGSFEIQRVFDPFYFALGLINADIIPDSGIDLGFYSVQNILISLGHKNLYPYIFLILISLICFLFKYKKFDKYNKLNLLILFTIILVYHGIYDFVILYPFVAYLIKEYKKTKSFFFHILTVSYILYLFKICKIVLVDNFHHDLISTIGFILVLGSSLIIIFLKPR